MIPQRNDFRIILNMRSMTNTDVKIAGVLIRGNHEDLFEALVTADEGIGYKHHVSNGIYDTAFELADFDLGLAAIRHYDFAEAAQKTAYHQKIIPAMLDYFEAKHCLCTWLDSLLHRAQLV